MKSFIVIYNSSKNTLLLRITAATSQDFRGMVGFKNVSNPIFSTSIWNFSVDLMSLDSAFHALQDYLLVYLIQAFTSQ